MAPLALIVLIGINRIDFHNINYKNLLQNSFEEIKSHGNPDLSPLEYLGGYIFEFTTYDDSIDRLFGEKALEVCEQISDGTVFGYLQDDDNYKWYLIMINMPFFSVRLDWGSSIRGAWWSHSKDDLSLFSTGLFESSEQVLKLEFETRDDWIDFVKSMRWLVDDCLDADDAGRYGQGCC